MTVKLNNDLCLVYNAANQVYRPGLRPQRHTCNSSHCFCQPAASCDFITNYEPPDGGRIYRSTLYQLHTNIPSHPTLWSHRTPRSFTLFTHWLSADGALAVNWKGWRSDSLMIVIISSALAVTFSQWSTNATRLVGRTVSVWSAAANLVATKNAVALNMWTLKTKETYRL